MLEKQNLKSITDKILSFSTLNEVVRKWKVDGETIVFTNGVFDLIHQGHIAYLNEAASLGTKLVIGLNADASVKTLQKGPARPIKDEQSRAVILAAMQFVAAVVVFSDPTPLELIEEMLPHVLVKGGDYDPKEEDANRATYIVGRTPVLANDGKVEVIPFLKGYSTTALEKKIIALNS